MGVEFVGSLTAPRAFSSGTPVFPVTKKKRPLILFLLLRFLLDLSSPQST